MGSPVVKDVVEDLEEYSENVRYLKEEQHSHWNSELEVKVQIKNINWLRSMVFEVFQVDIFSIPNLTLVGSIFSNSSIWRLEGSNMHPTIARRCTTRRGAPYSWQYAREPLQRTSFGKCTQLCLHSTRFSLIQTVVSSSLYTVCGVCWAAVSQRLTIMFLHALSADQSILVSCVIYACS